MHDDNKLDAKDVSFLTCSLEGAIKDVLLGLQINADESREIPDCGSSPGFEVYLSTGDCLMWFLTPVTTLDIEFNEPATMLGKWYVLVFQLATEIGCSPKRTRAIVAPITDMREHKREIENALRELLSLNSSQ